MVTASIDLPVNPGMLVYENGAIDFAVYRTKLESLGSSVRRYERARITQVRIKGNQLQIKLNKGGQPVGLAGRNALRWILPEQMNALGTQIYVDYGRPPSAMDMHPAAVARILRDVLTLDGVAAAPEAAGAAMGAESPSVPATTEPAAGARLLSVEVLPSRVVRGRELNLAVHFEVAGASTAQPMGLTISRQIYRGEEPLFSAPRVQQGFWASGVHTANFTFKVPPSAGAGHYRFNVALSADGSEESRDALFEVLAGTD